MGTGLGLSQVYGFIAQSGGDVLIHSEPGQGATISIYLPVATDTSGDADTAAGPPLDTVLLVEDEPDLLDATAQLLQSLGYDVLTARNGAEAMEVLRRHDSIGVLFTDVVMPDGINGIQLARSTRSLHPYIRIVLASGYPLPALKAQHGNLSDFAFIHKPYRLADLVRALGMAT